MRKSSFERRTYLENIEFSELGLYDKLLTQIEEFQKKKAQTSGMRFRASVSIMVPRCLLPVIKQIQQEKLLINS